MFTLPKSVRVGPSKIINATSTDGLSIILSFGEDPRNPLFSIKSPRSDSSGIIPLFEAPLSRDFLAISDSFHFVLVATDGAVLGVSQPLGLSNSTLIFELTYSLSPFFSILTALTVLPAGSFVPSHTFSAADASGCSRPCRSCASSGFILCSGCLGEAEQACPACEGKGCEAIVTIGVSNLAAACPVLERRVCRECVGCGVFRCPVCDGVAKIRCGECLGRGAVRTRLSYYYDVR
jgi:hypothetical protein